MDFAFQLPLLKRNCASNSQLLKAARGTAGFQCPTQDSRALCMTGLPFKALSQISEYLCINSQRRARTQRWTLDVVFWQVASLFKSLYVGG